MRCGQAPFRGLGVDKKINMDIPFKKHPLVKYRYYILGGALFLAFTVYVIIARTEPRRIRYDKVNLFNALRPSHL
jgi:hypothetical protein